MCGEGGLALFCCCCILPPLQYLVPSRSVKKRKALLAVARHTLSINSALSFTLLLIWHIIHATQRTQNRRTPIKKINLTRTRHEQVNYSAHFPNHKHIIFKEHVIQSKSMGDLDRNRINSSDL